MLGTLGPTLIAIGGGINFFANAILPGFIKILSVAKWVVGGLGGALGFLFSPLGLLLLFVGAVGAAFHFNFLGIGDRVRTFIDSLLWTLNNFTEQGLFLFIKWMGMGGKSAKQFAARIIAAYQHIKTQGGAIIGAILTSLLAIRNAFNSDGLFGAIEEAAKQFPQLFGNILNNLNDLFIGLFLYLSPLAAMVANFFIGIGRDIRDQVLGWGDQAKEAAPGIGKKLEELFDFLMLNLPAIFERLGFFIGKIINFLVMGFLALLPVIGDTIKLIAPKVLASIGFVVTEVLPRLLKLGFAIALAFMLGLIAGIDAQQLLAEMLLLANQFIAWINENKAEWFNQGLALMLQFFLALIDVIVKNRDPLLAELLLLALAFIAWVNENKAEWFNQGLALMLQFFLALIDTIVKNRDPFLAELLLLALAFIAWVDEKSTEWFNQGLALMLQFFLGIIQTIIEGRNSLLAELLLLGLDIINWITTKKTELYNSAIELGKKIVNGIIDGIKQLKQQAIDEINELASLIPGAPTVPGGSRDRSGVTQRDLIERARNAASGSGGFTFGRRALGGLVQKGKGYIVGEKGPEPFFPGASGYVMANKKMHESLKLAIAGMMGGNQMVPAGASAAAPGGNTTTHINTLMVNIPEGSISPTDDPNTQGDQIGRGIINRLRMGGIG